ncbi:MAG: Dolichol-phosphate mannosyltransferase, partial [uncultured Cytophagales bacterium]
ERLPGYYPDLQRDRERRTGDPQGVCLAAAVSHSHCGRWFARRHGGQSEGVAGTVPPPVAPRGAAGQAGPGNGLHFRVQIRHPAGLPLRFRDGRRPVAQPPRPAQAVPRLPRRRVRPGHWFAVHQRRKRGQLAHEPGADVVLCRAVRAVRDRNAHPRRHGGLQVLPPPGARSHGPRPHQVRGLRVPDRNEVFHLEVRLSHQGSAHHLHRPGPGPVQDERQHHPRSRVRRDLHEDQQLLPPLHPQGGECV